MPVAVSLRRQRQNICGNIKNHELSIRMLKEAGYDDNYSLIQSHNDTIIMLKGRLKKLDALKGK